MENVPPNFQLLEQNYESLQPHCDVISEECSSLPLQDIQTETTQDTEWLNAINAETESILLLQQSYDHILKRLETIEARIEECDMATNHNCYARILNANNHTTPLIWMYNSSGALPEHAPRSASRIMKSRSDFVTDMLHFYSIPYAPNARLKGKRLLLLSFLRFS
jgi:hypothetical protein